MVGRLPRIPGDARPGAGLLPRYALVDAMREQDFVAAKRLIATVAPAAGEEEEDAKLFKGVRAAGARRGLVSPLRSDWSGLRGTRLGLQELTGHFETL